MQCMKNWILLVGGLGGAAGVVAGALGSHALALDPGSPAGHSFGLAVTYLLLHSVAMLALGLHRTRAPRIGVVLQIAAGLFTAGMILFSGTLIVATVADLPQIKALAPTGGSAMIAGWLAVAVAAWRTAPA